ncbi:MAG: hypothetical protein J0I09_05495 [Sphingobacteriia bacterium]|nr:hypothetical protein [Sphingobacteriia bacterium]
MKHILLNCLLLLTLFSSCRHHNHNISISVKDREEDYQFSATYHKSATAKVQYYINQHISPSHIFESVSDDIDASTELKDGTRFYIKSHPGYLKIKLDKESNSEAAYLRIKEMCNGIKTELTTDR